MIAALATNAFVVSVQGLANELRHRAALQRAHT